MIRRYCILPMLGLLLGNTVWAQIITLVEPGAGLIAQAGAFTALPTVDPYALTLNPAQLGNFANQNNAAFAKYTKPVKWNEGYPSAKRLTSNIAAIGNQFDRQILRAPLSVGIAAVRMAIEKYNKQNDLQIYAIGLALNLPVQINIGYSYKRSSIKAVSAYPDGTPVTLLYHGYTQDFGAQITMPLIASPDRRRTFPDGSYPTLKFSLGYAVLNWDDT